MKSIFILIIFSFTSFAQTNEEFTKKLHHNIQGEKIFLNNEVDIQPKLMYGENAMYRFMSRNFKFPKNESPVTEIICSFIVEIDGTISDIKVINNVPESYQKEVIRVMNKFDEPWYPAVKNKMQVRCQYILPIKINLI
ncbi:MAG: energy transducer TonB [Flavobacterium sp.]|jgi:protein TonB|uniref:energy transducer TonB n=1 Tax=Flavobacterium sp. TaxID=239 RepID=UPI003BA45784